MNNKFPGIGEIKKVGPFMLSENSHTIEKKSNVAVYVSFGEFAGTLPLRWAYVLAKVREEYEKKGKKFVNVEDYGRLLGMKYSTEKKVWESMTEQDWKDVPEDEKNILAQNTVDVQPYETFKIHNLANMFPFNLHPALVQSKIEHSIMQAKRWLSMDKGTVMLWVMVMIGGALAAGIAYMLISKGEASQCKVTIEQAPGLIQAAGSVVSNFTA